MGAGQQNFFSWYDAAEQRKTIGAHLCERSARPMNAAHLCRQARIVPLPRCGQSERPAGSVSAVSSAHDQAEPLAAHLLPDGRPR